MTSAKPEVHNVSHCHNHRQHVQKMWWNLNV